MTTQVEKSFMKAVVTQLEINRISHCRPKEDDRREPLDWGVMAGEHMGHLLGALRSGDLNLAQKEILHVCAVMLECWNTIKSIKSSRECDDYLAG